MTRRPARRSAFAVLSAAAIVLGATRGWGAPEAVPAGGQRIPSFELATVAGGTASDRDFAGRVVLYEFWATWCTPCHVQVEILKQLFPRASEAGVEFVAIASGEPEEIVRRYAAEHPLPYSSLLDPEERLGTALEVIGLPTLVVADRAGVVVWRQTNLTDAETIVDALRRAGATIAD